VALPSTNGKALTMFVAFSSEAEKDEHYKVRADWLICMSKVRKFVSVFCTLK
jgi:hypothetical protein